MTVPTTLRARVLQAADYRCGYCQAQQAYLYEPLQVEHVWPRARGGTSDEANLWAACALCNRYKGDRTHGRDPVTGRRVRLFHPRRQRWARHFAWSANGTEILGRTVCGSGRLGAAALGTRRLASASRRKPVSRTTTWRGRVPAPRFLLSIDQREHDVPLTPHTRLPGAVVFPSGAVVTRGRVLRTCTQAFFCTISPGKP
jgi:hypothetical protein